MAAHRVAHQDDGLPDDVLDELVHEPGVGADGRRSVEQWRASEAGQVERDRVVVLSEHRCDGHPVEGVGAETVDHEERGAAAAPVDEMDGALEVYDAMAQRVNPNLRGWKLSQDSSGQSHQDVRDRGRRSPAVSVQAIERGERGERPDHVLGLFQ